jgi:hypothetical protein
MLLLKKQKIFPGNKKFILRTNHYLLSEIIFNQRLIGIKKPLYLR